MGEEFETERIESKVLESSPVGFCVAARLGFEPRLTDPLESIVLPLHQPILYEKVVQSLTSLALKLLIDDLIATIVSAFLITKPRRNAFGDCSGDSQDVYEHASSRKETQRGS